MAPLESWAAPRPVGRSPAAILAAAPLLLGFVAGGVRGQEPPDAGPGSAAPPEDSRLPTLARVQYDGGGDWYADPSSLPNLLAAVRERTGVRVAERPRRVRLTDPDLGDHPYLYLTGHGNVRLSEEEVVAVRRYLTRGGFLHADDNYGMDESFRREMARVFPDRELTEVPGDHPIYRIFYDLPEGLPKVHEHDGKRPEGLGIFLEGRLAVFYSYESDLGDGWEDPDVHGDPPEVREAALRMGVNLVLYAVASTRGP